MQRQLGTSFADDNKRGKNNCDRATATAKVKTTATAKAKAKCGGLSTARLTMIL
jgi:hypothetical protein